MKYKPPLILMAMLLFVSAHTLPRTNAGNEVRDLEQVKKILSKEIQKILTETGMPSISFALVSGDRIIWADAFGYANVKKQAPATAATIYSTGSTFKMATAIAVMQLVDAGKCNLDAPVNNYLHNPIKDLSSEGEPVTLRHLLSHHSGLDGPVEIIPLWERDLPNTLAEIASRISVIEPPGRNCEYCNHCFALAGWVIENVSGKSFQEYLVDHLFHKLDINTSGPVIPTPEMIEELALPYFIEKNRPHPEIQYRFDVFPAGDIYLTPSDMAKFLILLLNGGQFNGEMILKPETVKEILTPQFGSIYGLGMEISSGGEETRMEHGGAVPGFLSYFKADIDSKTGVYIVSNCVGSQDPLIALCDLSLDLLKGEFDGKPLPSFAKKSFEEMTLPMNILEKYIGEYRLEADWILTLSLEDKQLHAQKIEDEKVRLIPYAENEFFLKPGYGQIIFELDDAGRAVGLKYFKYEEVAEGIKIK